MTILKIIPIPKGATAVFVALLCGVLISGCGKPEEQPRPTPAPPPPPSADRGGERVATIWLDQDANSQITGVRSPVTDDPVSHGTVVALSRSKGQYAHWVASPPWLDVRLEIGMKKDSPNPFDGPFEAHGIHVFSGKVKADAAPGDRYQYWVKVTDNKTGKEFFTDPGIRVDP